MFNIVTAKTQGLKQPRSTLKAVLNSFITPWRTCTQLGLSLSFCHYVSQWGLCCSVYMCLNALASPSPMILPPVSGNELHRDTERVHGDKVASVYLPVLLLGLWQL